MSKLQKQNKNGSNIKKHGSKIQKNRKSKSPANRAGGGKTSYSALPVTPVDTEKKEDPAGKEQVAAEGNKPEGKAPEKEVIEKKEVLNSKEKMKIGGSKEAKIVQIVPYPKPEAKLDQNKQHSKGSKEHSQQKKLSKEKVSKGSSKEKIKSKEKVERKMGSKEKVERRIGSKGKMKILGAKEKTKDMGTKDIIKRTTEASKDISQEKKLTKEEIEMKNEKPKAKDGKMESEPVPQPKKTFLLKEGQMLLDKFKVEGLLADGGFAQVYACLCYPILTISVVIDIAHLFGSEKGGRRGILEEYPNAIHEESQTRWAVKIESEKCDRKRMKLEIMVLMLLRGKANIPEIMAMGTCPTGHFIILQLVGRNLSDLRRQLPHRRLSHGSLYRAMLQVTHALSLVHAIGFLHRDLKPSNCCVGVDDVTRIYLLDYGLTRQYLDSTGQIRKARESIGMRGTLRYVSLEAHNRHDLGPSHDLVALLYSIIELGDGHLPWSKMRDESAIKASKQETTAEKLCEKQPKMLKVAEYVLSMKYETMPDYDKLTKMLESCHPPEVNLNDPYDWQKMACQLDHLVKRDRSVEKPPESKPPENKNQAMISLISDLERPKQKTPARTPNAKTPRPN